MQSLLQPIRERAVENYLGRFVARPPVNPKWPVESSSLAAASIRWPRAYQWGAARDWVDVLKLSFKQYLPVKLVDDIPQPYKGTVVFEFVNGNKRHRVAIGYSDYLSIDEDCADAVGLYFKMQYAPTGYGRDNVVPGGYVPDGKRLYYYLHKLRRMRDRREFRFDVNGRFSLNYARDIREQAVGMLAGQEDLAFEGGLRTVSYADFLHEIARSKVCIDLPGLGPLCFRLMNYLAVGTCVIAYPHEAVLHTPLIDRKHIVYCKKDLSDLTDLCRYYLEHDDEREEIAANAREFFDLNLHKDNLVRYYLHTCVSRLLG